MTTHPIQITPAQCRNTAHVQMLDGSYWSAPHGTPLEAYFKQVYPEMVPSVRPEESPDKCTVIAALVDGTLRELTYPINRDALVRPVLLSDSDGLRIYRRSLSFLLIVAAEELFPGRKITIDHSLPFGGVYCAVINGKPFTAAELAQIRDHMHQIVAEDAPIVRRITPLDTALAIFRERGDDDKVRLMESRKKDYLVLYELHGMQEYFYGYMTPSTGYLTTFDLTHDDEGFILHYPQRSEPNTLLPIIVLPKLRSVFLESSKWMRLLGIPDVGALNHAIRDGHARELILVAEALHEGRFDDIANAISKRQPDVRLVLIAGPSSAGKTTSSKRLAIQLMAHGLKPYPIGLDNYFVDRDKTPLDEKGELDYEHLHAVDLDMFNDHLVRLMAGKEVHLPRYNFLNGKREEGDIVQLTPEHIIIVEGIHGLNPELVRAVPPESVFRLYISCLTQLNIDRHNRVPTTDMRLLRRMVRDAATRGYSGLQTLSRWRSVREGEHRWIFPYQENADIMFNSSLVYELAILAPLVEPLLLQIDVESPHHVEAKRLLAFLGWVEPLRNAALVPDNSLLREFIGGSILRDYTPGKPNLEYV
ncbi:MAG: nucleoside kinase [Anaerolineae bacterium]|nr:nucleoside kinase [Anaerolineae bacterium]